MNSICECGKKTLITTESDFAEEYTYEAVADIKAFLFNKTSIKPTVGIICGSGLGALADSVKNPFKINYEDIPNFPVSTAPGHAGKLIFGEISGVPVICMQGRFHYYEGYPLSKCVMPIKLMKLMGVTHLIASNAAGGLNHNFKEGDIMLQKDHFNIMGLAGTHPLRGFNDPRWGRRFFSMVNAYDQELLTAAKSIAKQMGISDQVHEGVYTCAGGPTYETVAELRALKTLGVDAVGMSTVHEVTAARHCNIKCFAFSFITNSCSLEYENSEEVSETHVLNSANSRREVLKLFIEKMVEFIGKS